MQDLKSQKLSSFNCEIFFTVCSLVTSSVIEEKMNNFALNSFGWCLTWCHTKIVIKPSSILQFDHRPSAVTIEQPGCIGDDRLNCGVCSRAHCLAIQFHLYISTASVLKFNVENCVAGRTTLFGPMPLPVNFAVWQIQPVSNLLFQMLHLHKPSELQHL